MSGFCEDFADTCIGGTITVILLSIVGMTFATIAMGIALVFGGLAAVVVAVIASGIAIASVIVTIFHTTFHVFCTVIQLALELLEFK